MSCQPHRHISRNFIHGIQTQILVLLTHRTQIQILFLDTDTGTPGDLTLNTDTDIGISSNFTIGMQTQTGGKRDRWTRGTSG